MGDRDKDVESKLNSCVKEYLQYVDLHKTADAMEDELKQSGRPLPSAASTDSLKNEIKSKMLAALEAGEHRKFFEIWGDVIPQHIRLSEGHKIEFYINIYFAIYPIHPLIKQTAKPKSLQDTMQIFTQFLATKGADLSKTSAFLAFYALPYVPDPSSHPSFQDLFTAEWLSELRTRVDKFLSSSVKPAKPALLRAYEFLDAKPKTKARSDDDVKYIQTLEQTNETMVKQNDKLQNEKSDLLSVAMELVQALQQTATGHQLSSDHLQHMFNQVSRFFSNQQIQAGAGRPPATPRGGRGRGGQQDRPLAALDYSKVQKDLLNSNHDLVARLLQALRWRLTKTEVGDARRRVFQTYIAHDLLACEPSAPRNILGQLLAPSSAPVVREYAARLVNCMSCECSGRAYLLDYRQLLSLLWDILVTEKSDTILRQQALGALQKLSLRRAAQTKMIAMGAVDWILRVLVDVDSISKYTLEYGSALLLNLSLRAAGRMACQNAKQDVLKVLSDLLECDNLQVRFYTNGTLYSVLARPALRERAHEMGMEDILKYLIQSSDENFANQIEYIMKQLSRKDDDDDGGNSDNEGDVEEEDDNDELVGDEEEAPEAFDSQPAGEPLLCSHYLAKTSDAQREDEDVRKSMDLRASKVGLYNNQPRSESPTSSSGSQNVRASRTASAPAHREKPQQQVPQRPVTPGAYSLNRTNGGSLGNMALSATMQPSSSAHDLRQQEKSRPRTPGSLSQQELSDMQNAFGTRSKMARTPAPTPAVPLEPLPQIKPRPKKKT